MKPILLRHGITFCSSFLLAIFSVYPVRAIPGKAEIDSYARLHGFPDSNYPYPNSVNGCGGSDRLGKLVPNHWSKVSLEAACNNHDRCYMRLGSDRNACDDNFYKDLRASCERDSYVRDPIFRKKIPDPVTLTSCYNVVTTYYASVRSLGGSYYQDAQKEAGAYDALVKQFLASDLASSTIPEGNFHYKGSVYYSNGHGNYCGFNSPLHYRLSSSRSWGQWLELSYLPELPRSMQYDGSCRVIIPRGNFHHDGSVYYSDGQGGYCGFTSPEHYRQKSRYRWGAWLEINERLPYQQFMRYDGPC